jgi:hypothetical protein
MGLSPQEIGMLMNYGQRERGMTYSMAKQAAQEQRAREAQQLAQDRLAYQQGKAARDYALSADKERFDRWKALNDIADRRQGLAMEQDRIGLAKERLGLAQEGAQQDRYMNEMVTVETPNGPVQMRREDKLDLEKRAMQEQIVQGLRDTGSPDALSSSDVDKVSELATVANDLADQIGKTGLFGGKKNPNASSQYKNTLNLIQGMLEGTSLRADIDPETGRVVIVPAY